MEREQPFVFDPEYASQMLQRDFPDLINKEQADAIAHLTAILERSRIRLNCQN